LALWQQHRNRRRCSKASGGDIFVALSWQKQQKAGTRNISKMAAAKNRNASGGAKREKWRRNNVNGVIYRVTGLNNDGMWRAAAALPAST